MDFDYTVTISKGFDECFLHVDLGEKPQEVDVIVRSIIDKAKACRPGMR